MLVCRQVTVTVHAGLYRHVSQNTKHSPCQGLTWVNFVCLSLKSLIFKTYSHSHYYHYYISPQQHNVIAKTIKQGRSLLLHCTCPREGGGSRGELPESDHKTKTEAIQRSVKEKKESRGRREEDTGTVTSVWWSERKLIVECIVVTVVGAEC